MKLENNIDRSDINLANGFRWREALGVALIGALLSLSACAGKQKSQDTANAEPVIDMTRPPTTIKGVSAAEEESNPDETVSFEKWNKERQSDE